jgi:hypothetical protein
VIPWPLSAAQPVQFNAAMTSTQSIIASPGRAEKAGAARTISLAVGRRIVNDDVIGRPHPDDPFRAGETVYAHTKLASFRDGFLEHVWKRDGVEVLREVMPIGEGRCWRTWSYHVLAAGAYSVEVFAPDGALLAWRAFNSL